MRFFNSSRPQSGAPLSSSLRGRRPDADPDGSPPGRSTITPTLVLLGVGIVLLAAALVIPSKAPSAVPTGALEPVVATTSDLGSTTPEDDLWLETEAERAGLGDDPAGLATTPRSSTARSLEGSSSASVTGDELTQAERAESARRKAANEKRARERKAAKARAKAAARRAAQRRRDARQRATQSPSTPAAPSRSGSSAVPQAPAAAPAPRRTTTRAPARRKPSRSSVAREFAGGL